MQEIVANMLGIVTNQWQRYKILAINIAMLVLVIIAFIYESYTVVNVIRSQSQNNNLSKMYASSGNQLIKNVTLADWHLFGVPPKVVAANVPKTKWNLLGVILGANPQGNYAVISSNDSDEGIYQTGDSLPDGALVAKILPNQVLLTRNNVDETLLISWDQTGDDVQQQTPQGPAVAPSPAPFANDVPPINSKEP